ncbi:S-adenosyl-L-methionine-dependent methyltransferase [Hygrophoropsis aurantiaca]|uniref:S-adenosyl-L-methionine-dependent methyltransferase n=1 Tax=Hygrophoropsis aurantiaca TaxID=72124 RepID=A0ACB8A9S9_9AGAM|nr:S-adenosyl-L-methionine-dependent methyltransferase [Hygrophoropsis aurantiaca]
MSSPSAYHFVPAEARSYQSTSQYILPNDDAEGARLDLQHWRIVKGLGGLIVAPVSLKEGDRVLESGAATGIWMLDFATHAPKNVQVEGIDISSRLFPASYPSNLTFSVNSITSLPESWSSSFAYVHQRLLISGLSEEMWKTAVSEIYRILKPGGWVELVECAMTFVVGPHTKKLMAIIEKLAALRGLLRDPKTDIPALLHTKKFVSVHCDTFPLPVNRESGEDGIIGNNNTVNVYAGMKVPILKAGGFGKVRDGAK